MQDTIYNEQYKKGAEDAWEAAGKFWLSERNGGFGITEIGELFGAGKFDEVFLRTSPLDAIEKIRQYEERNEFQVGDEVKCDNGYYAVVSKTAVMGNEHKMYVVFDDGSAGERDKSELTKTGRRFPQIVEVLAELEKRQDSEE